MSGIFQFSMTLGIETDGTSTNYDDAELVNIEEMIAPRSLWSKGRSILLPHAEEEGLSTPVLPSPHLMRFRSPSRPLAGMQSPCMTLVTKTCGARMNARRYKGAISMAGRDEPAWSQDYLFVFEGRSV
jgi:hypothetical protein